VFFQFPQAPEHMPAKQYAAMFEPTTRGDTLSLHLPIAPTLKFCACSADKELYARMKHNALKLLCHNLLS
jgi:hypothetical protein